MKKVSELLHSGKEYYLIIGNFGTTKDYGLISKQSDVVNAIKDFIKSDGNGKHNLSATLHETPESNAVAQTDFQVVVEFSINEI